MKKRKVTSITYGALICAMVGALLTVNRYVLMGGLDLYLYWIIPMPVIVYVVKFGTGDAIVMGVAMTLLSFILATPTTVLYVVASVIAGIAYGDGLNRGKSGTYLIVTLIVVSLVVMFVTTFVFAAAFGYNIADEIAYYQKTMADIAEKLPVDMTRMVTTKMLLGIVVILSVLSSVLEGILVHILAFLVLRRLKMQLPPMRPLGEITAPMWVKIFVAVTVAAFVLSRIWGYTEYDDYLIPVFTLSMVICSGFGYIAIVTYMALFSQGKQRKGISLFLGISYFLLFYLYVAVGFFDVFSDRRKKLIEELRRNYESQVKAG